MNELNSTRSMLVTYWLSLIGITILPIVLLKGIFLLAKIKSENLVSVEEKYRMPIIYLQKILYVGFGFALLFITIKGFNMYRDLPNVIQKRYCYDSGIVIGYDKSIPEDIAEFRGITIRSFETGTLIKLTVTYSSLYENDKVKVVYLKHSQHGAILEKLE